MTLVRSIERQGCIISAHETDMVIESKLAETAELFWVVGV